MSSRLGDRLASTRRQRFVGRRAELELFRTALAREAPDFSVLYLYGPGGIGKTTLLREFVQVAAEAGRLCPMVDGRHIDLTPAGFETALQRALDLPLDAPPLAALAAVVNPILCIDTYELVTPLDSWLRTEFLPQLPEQALVVIAGRLAPGAGWRADNGWDALTRVVALRNLRPDESAAYLAAAGVPATEIGHVVEVTHGHPLALSLTADIVRQNGARQTFELQRDPDIVRVLLEHFVADVPNTALRQALEICAHALTTTEALLAECLGAEHAYGAFQWLRSLSFIEQGRFGLFPHDLARDVLEVDLRWRNLPRFQALHAQVRNHVIQQCMMLTGTEQQQALFALLFLHRNNPFMRPFYGWQSFGQLYIDGAAPADLPEVEAMVLRHQGEEARAITRYWHAQQPESIYIFRGAGRKVTGFCQVVGMSALTPADCAADPAAAAVATYLQRQAPLQQGDVVYCFRNWMDAADYQQSPATFNMASMLSLRLYFGTARLAYAFITSVADEGYRRMFDYLRTPRAEDAGFTVDGQLFDIFVHDWRVEPVLTWLEIMGERELLDEIVALDTLTPAPQPVVLSEPEFASAVRQALKDLRRLDLLAQSPLLQSRVLRDRVAEPAPADLQALLRDAAAELSASPRELKLHRVLWHTYFEPATSQEAAAELLDLPFSTYRYQLGKAVERVTTWLWQRELYGSE